MPMHSRRLNLTVAQTKPPNWVPLKRAGRASPNKGAWLVLRLLQRGDASLRAQLPGAEVGAEGEVPNLVR